MTSSPRASFWTAASVVGLALWASGAPTVVYPLYAQDWHLAPSVTTAIFAIYPLVLVPVLIVFGNLSDVIGRRAVILMGLAALAAGSVAFGLAPDLTWVFVGRALMGIGVGLALSPATAAMVEFGGRDGARRASSATTAASAAGLALATIVGGALVQYAPAPLHLSFWVLVAVTVLVIGFAFALPRHTRDESAGPWRPRLPRVPRDERPAFIAGTLGISAAFAMGAIYLALGAQIARDLVRSDNVFVDGAIISLSAIAIGVVAIAARSVAPRVAVTVGPGLAVVGLGLLVVAGLVALAAGLRRLVAHRGRRLQPHVLGRTRTRHLERTRTPPRSGHLRGVHHRLPRAGAAALGIGAIATTAGLQFALEVGAPLILLLGVAALVVANARRTPVAV